VCSLHIVEERNIARALPIDQNRGLMEVNTITLKSSQTPMFIHPTTTTIINTLRPDESTCITARCLELGALPTEKLFQHYEQIYSYTELTQETHSPTRQQHFVQTEEAQRRNRSSCQHLEHIRPLGMSNLRELNQSRNPMHAMDRRLYESQHAGPYDGIQYVGRRSDYELFRDQG
jgi:hypothetical protein